MKQIYFFGAALLVVLCVSCKKSFSPVETDGHSLWFASLEAVQSPLTADLTTEELAQRNIDLYWKDGRKVTFVQGTSEELGNEGFSLKSEKSEVVIAANTPIGCLYGSYELIRRQESGSMLSVGETFNSVPAYQYRVLNHWDNPNGTVERGFAGQSIWKWEAMSPANDDLKALYREYAAANASVGINGTVLNNVNADPCMLSAEYLSKVKMLADIFRPYGIKVFLSINFAAPKHLGGLQTSDPLDVQVASWWKNKIEEIYSLIPDFGGFLVKANSEGQSGPQDYGRTHADGANMLAAALKPHGGIVMWRAFVYAPTSPDRAMQAVEEFKPLDGQFLDNVIIQVKNGPVDFQPREPFSPLFGQLEHTQVMPELQITQEYMGHSNHLVYLHPMWKECLDSDTYQYGKGSTVAAMTSCIAATETRKIRSRYTAIAGVANIGDSVNWCGHPFAAANWYAFGRLAWNPSLSSEQIAREWLCQTFGTQDEKFIEPVAGMMLSSHEAAVHYEMPLGIHHAFAGAGHYGPGPWEGSIRPDWSPMYYHKAAEDGVGFDRTLTGSGAVAQYHEPLCSMYNDVTTCPENLLLWFHHLPWSYTMKSGHTLWDELCLTYQAGIDTARSYIDVWNSVESYVCGSTYSQVAWRIERQAKDAIWWRDAVIQYFQQYSQMSLPEGCSPFQHSLDELRAFRLRISNYETPDPERLPEYILK